MQMSEEEIVRKYKENRTKKGYTNILAQLNCCSKQDINDILRKHGVDLPGNPNFGKPKAALKKEEPKTIEKKVEETSSFETNNDTCEAKLNKEAVEEVVNKLKEEKVEETIVSVTNVDTPSGLACVSEDKKISITEPKTMPDSVRKILLGYIDKLISQRDIIDAKINEIQEFLNMYKEDNHG